MSNEILQLDPTQIDATSNIRFGLKRYRLDRLKEDITEAGGVETPVQVFSNPDLEASKTNPYILWKGFYRTQAVTELNKTGAGLTLPAMLVDAPDEVTRIRRQIAENQERENMSPMDIARAITQLEAQKVPKIDIRNIFSVPGGKKGNKIQPASNSYVNMHKGFLDFPKAIQTLIHDNVIGVGAANDLRTKHDKSEWDGIVAKALENREKEIAKADAAELKLLNEEKGATAKQQEAEVKAAEAAKVLETVETGTKTMEELKASASTLFNAMNAPGLTKDTRDAAKTEFKKAEAALNEGRKAVEKAQKEAGKIQAQADKAAETAASAKTKIDEARAAKLAAKVAKGGTEKPKKGIGQKEVNAAAKETGSTGAVNVKLNGAQMREVVHNWTLAGQPQIIMDVFKAVEDCFLGVTTDKQAFGKIKKLIAPKA